MSDSDPTYHPEELERAERENRPVLVSQLFRYDHLPHAIEIGELVDIEVEIHSSEQGSNVNLKGFCRLFVVERYRDCDGSPLYILADRPVRYPSGEKILSPYSNFYRAVCRVILMGQSEERLKRTGQRVEIVSDLYSYFGAGENERR